MKKSPPSHQHNLNDEDDIYNIPDGIFYSDTEGNAVNDILDAALFHDKLHEGGIHHQTIQIFSRGNPACCALHADQACARRQAGSEKFALEHGRRRNRSRRLGSCPARFRRRLA